MDVSPAASPARSPGWAMGLKSPQTPAMSPLRDVVMQSPSAALQSTPQRRSVAEVFSPCSRQGAQLFPGQVASPSFEVSAGAAAAGAAAATAIAPAATAPAASSPVTSWSPLPNRAAGSTALSPVAARFSPALQGSPARHCIAHQALSPGAEIRLNAANFGIPLSLRSAYPGEVAVPVPVRNVTGAVVAPSPVHRGLQRQVAFPHGSTPGARVLNFDAAPASSAVPPLPTASLAGPVSLSAAPPLNLAQPLMASGNSAPGVMRPVPTPLSSGIRRRCGGA